MVRIGPGSGVSVERACYCARFSVTRSPTVIFILDSSPIRTGIVGFVEERNAGNAVAALKSRLAMECRLCRDGV